MGTLLKVDDLRTYFFTEAGIVKAVDGVGFELEEGGSLGFVGESGSGKTITALSVMGVIPRPGKIVSGSINYRGENLVGKSEKELRRVRGKKIGYVSQDPNSSLDPLFTVGSQLTEVIRAHKETTKESAKEEALSLLKLVSIPEPEARLKAYPHELSGGMKQRIAIARAIAGQPELLIADEPTTNLDVTIQAQILELLTNLQSELKMALIMITHDMGIIAETTKRVVVFYAGMKAENAETVDIFGSPKHPYTSALLASIPRTTVRRELIPIPGNIPNLISPPEGCRYHPRCPYVVDKCKQQVPPWESSGPHRMVACHRWKELTLESG
ncbi:MAG: ABC transporter ATP-binding protein [Nitrososphaerota archaeon]|nr:ABC transporter ATP-binding protein [Nitrososphaerota archaeon]